jgi:hypothetical protein
MKLVIRARLMAVTFARKRLTTPRSRLPSFVVTLPLQNGADEVVLCLRIFSCSSDLSAAGKQILHFGEMSSSRFFVLILLSSSSASRFRAHPALCNAASSLRQARSNFTRSKTPNTNLILANFAIRCANSREQKANKSLEAQIATRLLSVE